MFKNCRHSLAITVYSLDTVLEFEEASYSIKFSYGRRGKVFKFVASKIKLRANEKTEQLDLNKLPESDKYFSKENFVFKGNYSLEYVPGNLNYNYTVVRFFF